MVGIPSAAATSVPRSPSRSTSTSTSRSLGDNDAIAARSLPTSASLGAAESSTGSSTSDDDLRCCAIYERLGRTSLLVPLSLAPDFGAAGRPNRRSCLALAVWQPMQLATRPALVTLPSGATVP